MHITSVASSGRLVMTQRLMPAKYVRPYSRGQKNDFRDAEAIAEAVQRPTMKFVATKTSEQLDPQALQRSGTVILDFAVSTLYKFAECPNEGGKMQGDSAATVKGSNELVLDIAPLSEEDLPEAERIFRVAFGTFLGAPDPEVFWADRDYVYGRHRAPHVAAFGATIEGNLVGSNFVTKWGSVGFFGPITVRPDLQERGIAQALLARTIEQFDAWQTRHVGLFTFPHSAKHIGLYQKYGFYARFLTAIMSAPVSRRPSTVAGWSRYSDLNVAQQNEALLACQDIADTLYPGLDLTDTVSTSE